MHSRDPAAGSNPLKLAECRRQDFARRLFVPELPSRAAEPVEQLRAEERVLALVAQRDRVLESIDRAADIP